MTGFAQIKILQGIAIARLHQEGKENERLHSAIYLFIGCGGLVDCRTRTVWRGVIMKPLSGTIAALVFILMISEPARADYIPEPPAAPYAIEVQDALSVPLTAVQCLALNIYHEARGEVLTGQYAVAMVTLNRMRSRHYPDSVCGVVLQSFQYSWTHDGRTDHPEVDSDEWRLAYNIAYRFLVGGFYVPWMASLTHYHRHDIDVYWPRLRVAVMIGDHVFYEPNRGPA